MRDMFVEWLISIPEMLAMAAFVTAFAFIFAVVCGVL